MYMASMMPRSCQLAFPDDKMDRSSGRKWWARSCACAMTADLGVLVPDWTAVEKCSLSLDSAVLSDSPT